MFEIIEKDALGRIGKFSVNGKSIITPNIFPVVHPRNQIIDPRVMHSDFGVDAVFTNAYLIFRDAGLNEVVSRRGVHGHLGFDGIIATDSGAFQHYMYGADDLEARVIERFQEEIGSDLGVILDQPVQVDDTRDVATRKVQVTLERAAENVAGRTCDSTSWYAPIHGGRFPDLLERSARVMNGLDYAVNAVGGVVKLLNNYHFPLVSRIILQARKHLTPGRPVHLFGAGHPMVFALFASLGCDLFDSAAYSLFAKEGRYLTTSGTMHLDDLVEFPCCCPVCTSYKPRELKGLESPQKFELLARHNLHVTMAELREIREHIRRKSLWQLVETRCRNHPRLLEALRVVNSSHLSPAEEPMYGSKAVFYTGAETLHRPNVVHFRHHVRHHYSILPAVKRILIAPDLDVNAISSPQFKRWMGLVNEAYPVPGNRVEMLVVILNPVLGVIPEDLMSVYPASHNLFPLELDKDQQHLVIEELIGFLDRDDARGIDTCVLLPDDFDTELGYRMAYDAEYLHDALEKMRDERSDAKNLTIISREGELARWLGLDE
ncbi:MAG: tRNA guanosine(15) transglycosylase TgtA [Promethearchaeota archaeon]